MLKMINKFLFLKKTNCPLRKSSGGAHGHVSDVTTINVCFEKRGDANYSLAFLLNIIKHEEQFFVFTIQPFPFPTNIPNQL